MLSKKMLDAFNKQINEEVYSSYLYLAMAAHFAAEGLPGFSRWMRAQSEEENLHAMKFYDYIFERGGKVVLDKIKKPTATWDSPLAVFEATLKHEQFITGCINNLVKLAREENDYASEAFLQWYVMEQVEEEDGVRAVLDQLKLAGSHPHGIFMLDKALGERGTTTPAAE